ncbi:hypothetical protein GCM10017744_095780 [Streptomyces antimycoticus]|uniref:Secreted protein n=1 Tax=Streptomyces antimycoticus TaxID=68175 RepID=A0A4D4JT49_9ACTN|nr:hypothetical protein [Streptomyces antimycoticus]GDY39911.1 hypothetical protein SANT12839_007930 [Streptomyces antimycoticus]
MSEVLPYLIVAGVLAALMGFLGWVAALARRRGATGAALRAALASHDEAFRVTAHDSHHEILAQAERKAPILAPDGQWTPSHALAGPGGRRPSGPRALRTRRGLLRRWGRRVRGR